MEKMLPLSLELPLTSSCLPGPPEAPHAATRSNEVCQSPPWPSCPVLRECCPDLPGGHLSTAHIQDEGETCVCEVIFPGERLWRASEMLFPGAPPSLAVPPQPPVRDLPPLSKGSLIF